MTGDPAPARSPLRERRVLQIIVALACIVPFYAGGSGVVWGADFIHGANIVSQDLDSHFRYLSGLLLGIGVMFASCIPRIETATGRFQTLGIVVIVGGLARAYGMTVMGVPSGGQMFGLAMEIGVVPLLMAWQANFAWRHARAERRAAIAP
ncbi:DUF4345 domain-containing protein [Sphingorhabdus soli]|uniref:DUF4345 domain-containing protein n=1 Tax=Flavisphingopyxis soli TaxID=2601267 RepID=A0A5C6UMA5_9SPHN|nr:DUF4345 domain-containing protein [Sphingorhabdus soli]TXC73650.1 DUF4345 domain-containing protein [Sphingorhabdus soli]